MAKMGFKATVCTLRKRTVGGDRPWIVASTAPLSRDSGPGRLLPGRWVFPCSSGVANEAVEVFGFGDVKVKARLGRLFWLAVL